MIAETITIARSSFGKDMLYQKKRRNKKGEKKSAPSDCDDNTSATSTNQSYTSIATVRPTLYLNLVKWAI